jgi:hypothetical protein
VKTIDVCNIARRSAPLDGSGLISCWATALSFPGQAWAPFAFRSEERGAAKLPSLVRKHRLGDRAILCLLWPSVEIELTWVARDSLPLIPIVSERPEGAG